MSKLSMELKGDRVLIIRRSFKASPLKVYEAHIKPELIPRWMTGPSGWSMVACECEPQPGGRFRFEWADDSGAGFYSDGTFHELIPGELIRHVERMHMPEATPDNEVTTTFEADGSGTLLTVRMEVPNKEARDAMAKSGMDAGMEASYQELDALNAP